MNDRWTAFGAGLLVLCAALPAWAQTDGRVISVQTSAFSYLLTDTFEVEVVVDSADDIMPVDVPVRIHLSTDDTLDGMDLPVQTATVTVATESSQATLRFATPIEQGNWFVLAELDPDDTLSDPDRSNNVRAFGRVTIEEADFRVFRVVTLPQAFVGRQLLYVVDVRNDGPSDWMEGAQVLVQLVPNRASGAPPLDVRTEMTGPMASGDQVSYEGSITVPTNFPLGLGALTATVTPTRAGVDGTANNNTVSTAIEILFDAPDLQGVIVTSTAAIEAGQDLLVSSRIENLGLVDADPTEVIFVLSEDDVIEASDILIGRFAVPALSTSFIDVRVDETTVPLTMTPGRYRLGMIIDPDDVIEEIDDENNAVAGAPVDVFAPDLQVLTSSLAPARTGVPYEAGLAAVGGPVPDYAFTVAAGDLPPEIELEEDSGILSGTPTEEGRFDFTIEVKSGGATARRPLFIFVVDPTVDLTVSVTDLGARLAGRPFLIPLLATGGLPPYTWEPLEDPPVGTVFSADGSWSGTVADPAQVSFRVRVTDQLSEQAEAEIVARFVDGVDAVSIMGRVLPTGRVGRPYCETETVRLEAMGAFEPFRFSAASPPPGLALEADGTLCGTPTEVGTFTFSVNASDDLGLVDSAVFTLEVEGDASVEVQIEDLPNATLNVFYERAFTVTGGTEPYAFSLFTQSLPAGMEVTSEGRIRGTPTELGLFPFAVEVRDARGVIDRAPFSLRVVEPEGPPEEGCSCRTSARGPQAGAGGLLALAFALSWVRRRRR